MSTSRVDLPHALEDEAFPLNYTPDDFVQAVTLAGGVPMLLALHDPQRFPGMAEQQVSMLDALIVIGGDDISPASYGAQPHPRLARTLPDRDRHELALLAAARKRGIPVLAVCRGMQLVNVAFGGTLYQDLPSEFTPADGVQPVQHVQRSLRVVPSHGVTVTVGSRVADLVGATDLSVSSFHHQAVRQLGEGLTVTAIAPDGVIEAVESTLDPWLVGVQWHPEMTAPDDVPSQRLFRRFVEVASRQG